MKPFVHEDGGTLSMHFDITAIQSRMRRDDPAALALGYTRTMMACLLFCPQPSSLLMIGLGGGSLPKYAHRTLPRSDITVVEINPHVIAMRDAFHVPGDDARFRVVRDDGAAFVARTGGRYDVLMVDGFTWEGMPESLSSAAFLADCRAALAPRGVLVVNLHEDDCERVTGRIAAVFDGHLVCVPAAESSNRIVIAAPEGVLDVTVDIVRARLAALGDAHQATLRGEVARVVRAITQPERGRAPGAKARPGRPRLSDS